MKKSLLLLLVVALLFCFGGTALAATAIYPINAINLDMPGDVDVMDTSVTQSTKNCSASSVVWNDVTEDKDLAAGDKAVAGSFTFDLSKESTFAVTTKLASAAAVKVTANFDAGVKYVYVIKDSLTKSGYSCTCTPSAGQTGKVNLYSGYVVDKLLLNGTALTVASDGSFTFDLSEESTFEVTTKLAAGLPVITGQPKAVSIKPGENATFTVAATGEGLHYQWWGVDAGIPIKVGTDSPTYAMTKVLADWNGFNFWCVITNAAGEVTSSKALLAITDTPYVFPFKDVTSADWFYKDVQNANLKKLIDGKSATAFKPAENMTYAEAIKLAACMHQLYHDGAVTLGNGSPTWYQSYVDYAKVNGIPWDFPNYNVKISRAEYVHIFYYALPISEYTQINNVVAVPDVVGDIYLRYGNEIITFYAAGILTGNDSMGTFAPNGNIKRSEVAAILSRMIDDTARKTFTLDGFGGED